MLSSVIIPLWWLTTYITRLSTCHTIVLLKFRIHLGDVVVDEHELSSVRTAYTVSEMYLIALLLVIIIWFGDTVTVSYLTKWLLNVLLPY